MANVRNCRHPRLCGGCPTVGLQANQDEAGSSSETGSQSHRVPLVVTCWMLSQKGVSSSLLFTGTFGGRYFCLHYSVRETEHNQHQSDIDCRARFERRILSILNKCIPVVGHNLFLNLRYVSAKLTGLQEQDPSESKWYKLYGYVIFSSMFFLLCADPECFIQAFVYPAVLLFPTCVIFQHKHVLWCNSSFRSNDGDSALVV